LENGKRPTQNLIVGIEAELEALKRAGRVPDKAT
jgi:hypothetical protein